MKQRLRTKGWWPNTDKDIDRFVKLRHSCQLVSIPDSSEKMRRRKLTNAAWKEVGIDLFWPLKT